MPPSRDTIISSSQILLSTQSPGTPGDLLVVVVYKGQKNDRARTLLLVISSNRNENALVSSIPPEGDLEGRMLRQESAVTPLARTVQFWGLEAAVPLTHSCGLGFQGSCPAHASGSRAPVHSLASGPGELVGGSWRWKSLLAAPCKEENGEGATGGNFRH